MFLSRHQEAWSLAPLPEFNSIIEAGTLAGSWRKNVCVFVCVGKATDGDDRFVAGC